MTNAALPLQQLRRHTGAAGAPTSLLSGQFFVNDVDGFVYVGIGDNGNGVSTSQMAIGFVLNALRRGSLAIATTNVFPALPYAMAAGGCLQLIINRLVYASCDAAPLFTVSGTTVTWLPNAPDGFPLLPGTNVTYLVTY